MAYSLPLFLHLPTLVSSALPPTKWRRVYALRSTPAGSTRSRTRRKSLKRGYSARSFSGVHVCDFAQCGRPPAARMCDSNAAKRER